MSDIVDDINRVASLIERDDQFPLYPRLSEEGKQEAAAIIEAFKKQLIKVAEEALSTLYCDVTDSIESDSWTNFRNKVVEGMSCYNNRKVQGHYDFARIREYIYKTYHDEIIADLNQDILEENVNLKKQLQKERDWTRRER